MPRTEGERLGQLLSFVVPVFNEAPGIEELWASLAEAGDRAHRSGAIAAWEAVLVDDGSTDASAELLDGLAAAHAEALIVHHPVNRGLGAALASGFATSSGDVVVYTDADLPFDLAQVEGLIRPILADEADMVSARRIGRAREGRWRAVQSHLFNLLVRVGLRLPVRDANFACKAARRAAIPPAIVSTSGLVDVEWLLYAKDVGARIVQPTVEFVPRRWGRSTLGSIRTVPAMVQDLRRVLAARKRAGARG
ncbi:glycosyltransferase family 2 protein [Aquihabitans daechungensis]|uniref:glycosyltransferase family 2 protein n=1 Tax=Aquihabitans daechungensis TaxID=1052257 RepID=UPI003B9E54EF